MKSDYSPGFSRIARKSRHNIKLGAKVFQSFHPTSNFGRVRSFDCVLSRRETSTDVQHGIGAWVIVRSLKLILQVSTHLDEGNTMRRICQKLSHLKNIYKPFLL